MSTYTEQQKPNLTTEMFAEFLRQILTKEQQEEYNEMMKRCKGKVIVDLGKVFKEEQIEGEIILIGRKYLQQIEEGALSYWIEYNHKGLKIDGGYIEEEWLDADE